MKKNPKLFDKDQIALIEQSSSSLRVSQDSPDTDSDSDVLRPAPHSSPQGTLIGIGDPRDSAARLRPATPTQLQTLTAPIPRATDDNTGTRVTGTASTATLTLPTDRRLPILASAAGVLVLLVILFVVIFHTGAAEPVQTVAPPVTASAVVIGDPPPSAVPDPAPLVDPPEAPSVVPVPTPPPPHVTFKPLPPKPAPTPVQVVRKDCNPPYTLDPATGRKKYKLECM